MKVSKEQLLDFLSEVLENGYNIDWCLEHVVKKDYGLNDFDLIKISIIMKAFVFHKDSDYKKFSDHITRALNL